MFSPLSSFELGNYFLGPPDLRKIMGETEKPPPASPGLVTCSSGLPTAFCMYIQYLYYKVYHKVLIKCIT